MTGNEIRISQVTQEKARAGENLLPKRVTEWTTRVRGALSSSPDMKEGKRAHSDLRTRERTQGR